MLEECKECGRKLVPLNSYGYCQRCAHKMPFPPVKPDNSPKCPKCGGELIFDHNSGRCDGCRKLWPTSYLEAESSPKEK